MPLTTTTWVDDFTSDNFVTGRYKNADQRFQFKDNGVVLSDAGGFGAGFGVTLGEGVVIFDGLETVRWYDSEAPLIPADAVSFAVWLKLSAFSFNSLGSDFLNAVALMPPANASDAGYAILGSFKALFLEGPLGLHSFWDSGLDVQDTALSSPAAPVELRLEIGQMSTTLICIANGVTTAQSIPRTISSYEGCAPVCQILADSGSTSVVSEWGWTLVESDCAPAEMQPPGDIAGGSISGGSLRGLTRRIGGGGLVGRPLGG